MPADRWKPTATEQHPDGSELECRAEEGSVKQVEVAAAAASTPGEARAWWKVMGGFLVFFNIWGLPISFGAFQSFYTLELLGHYPASSISWIGTVQGALLVLVGLVSGPLYDLGYWIHLFVAGSSSTVFGMLMLSLSTKYYQVFLAQGVCVGLGCGLLYVPTLTLVGAAFSKHRALAMGLITSGIALGGIVFTILYIQLLPRLGFAWMVRVMAFINLGTFALAAPAMYTKQGGMMARKLFDRAALTDGPFLLFTAAQFFIFLGYLVPLYYIPIYAQVVLKTDLSVGLYILVGSQAGSLVGRIAATPFVSVTGTMLPWLICCLISGVLCFTWIAVNSLGSFIAFSVLYGFFSGALIALPPSVFPIICPDPDKLGSRMGVSWTSSALAFLVGAPIAGALINIQERNLLGAQVWSGVLLVLSGGLLTVLWASLAKKTGRGLV